MYVHPTTVKFKDYDCVVLVSYYQSHPDRKSIALNDFNTGEPVASVTINVVDDDTKPGEVVMREYSGTEGISRVLMDAGIIGPKVREVMLKFDRVPVHTVLVG